MTLESVQAPVLVPEGAVPGSTFSTMVEGQQMQVVVPPDAVPGMTITVKVMLKAAEASAGGVGGGAVRRENVRVYVPANWTPGKLLSVPTSQGKVLYSIPPGTVVTPGKKISLSVPVRERPKGSAGVAVLSSDGDPEAQHYAADWNPRDHFKESEYPNGDSDVVSSAE